MDPDKVFVGMSIDFPPVWPDMSRPFTEGRNKTHLPMVVGNTIVSVLVMKTMFLV